MNAMLVCLMYNEAVRNTTLHDIRKKIEAFKISFATDRGNEM